MIHRNCTATATERRYFEAMDVGLMLRSFRVVMITMSGNGAGFMPLDAVADTQSQTLFLSGDVYTSRHCHVHVHNLTYPVCPV